MAWALINHVTSVSTGAGFGVASAGITCTGADLIVAVIGLYNNVSNTFADSLNNTWHARTLANTSSDGSCQLFYATKFDAGFAVGAGQTFTPNAAVGSTYCSACIAAFSGSLTSASPYDAEGTHTGSAVTTIQPGSVGTSGELLITGCGFKDAGGPLTVDSSFTITDQVAYGSGTNEGSALAYLSTTGAVDPTWTFTIAAVNAGAVIASFKAAAGGGATSGLFMQTPMNGLGVGGPFFPNPLGAPVCQMPRAPRGFARRSSIYVPERMAA